MYLLPITIYIHTQWASDALASAKKMPSLLLNCLRWRGGEGREWERKYEERMRGARERKRVENREKLERERAQKRERERGEE